MKTKLMLPLTLSLIIFGCADPLDNKEETIIQEKEIPINPIEEEEHHHDEHEAIVLNNGEKWKVVDNMLIYIRNMEEAITTFEGSDYPALAKTIDKNIRALTESCTMEGQAHDELHKWLVPFIGLSEEFDVATEKEEQERIYQSFKDAFVEFNVYFE